MGGPHRALFSVGGRYPTRRLPCSSQRSSMRTVPPEQHFFFAVGSSETVMSSVWKVTAKQGEMDVYISESGSGQHMHVSLHQEQWQVSVRKEFVTYGRDRGSPHPAMSWKHPM